MTLCSTFTSCLRPIYLGLGDIFQPHRRVNDAANRLYEHHGYDLEATVQHIENWLQTRMFTVGFSDWHCGGRLHDSHQAPALGAVSVIESENGHSLSVGLFYRSSRGSVHAIMDANREDCHLALRGLATLWLQLMHTTPSTYVHQVLPASDEQVARFCEAVLQYEEHVIVRHPRNRGGAERPANYHGLNARQTLAKALLIATERMNFAGDLRGVVAGPSVRPLPSIDDVADRAGLSVGQIREYLGYDNRLTPAGFELICENHLTRFVDSLMHSDGNLSDASDGSDASGKSDTLFSQCANRAPRAISKGGAVRSPEAESLL